MMYVITIHSFTGSSLEASAPILAYGPFDKKYAEELYVDINQLLTEDFSQIEMIAHSTYIPYQDGPQDETVDIQMVLEDLRDYWNLDNNNQPVDNL